MGPDRKARDDTLDLWGVPEDLWGVPEPPP
jgi:hypothetical protein